MMNAWDYWVIAYYGQRGPHYVGAFHEGKRRKPYPMPDQAGKLAISTVHKGQASRDMEIQACQSREDISRIAWGSFDTQGRQVQHFDGNKADALVAVVN